TSTSSSTPAAKRSSSCASLLRPRRKRRKSRSRSTSRGSRNTCDLDPSHPAEDPLADGLRHVPDGRRRSAVHPLRRGPALRENLKYVVDAHAAGIDRGHRLRHFVEEMTVAPSRLPELPLPGQRASSEVPPSQRPAVARLICRKRGLRNRDGAE